jgi:TonB family protein
MQVRYSPSRASFGLLPEPEGRSAAFFTSMAINAVILIAAIVIGMTAREVIVEHKYEQTELILPTNPPPPVKVKVPPPPKIAPPPRPPEVKLEAPKINIPKPEPKPEVKPIQMEAKLNLPVIKSVAPKVVEAPQPKQALTFAAAPALTPQAHPVAQVVHGGDLQGVAPNPNATRPATVMSAGNPYGGLQGPAMVPHGVVGSTGIGNGTRSGSNAGVVGKVASVGVQGTTAPAATGSQGKVATLAIPEVAKPAFQQASVAPATITNLELLSKPPAEYTSEARQLKVQGDVVLRVTFTANGRVVVQGVVHSLGHGLDEEARRVAEQIRFRPATRNGQAVDLTTNITISFQLA